MSTLLPLQLAAQEVQYGLSLLAGAATLAASPGSGVVGSAVATLLAYPREALAAAANSGAEAAVRPVQLEAPGVQQALAELAAEAARDAAAATAAASAAGPGAAARAVQERADLAAMSTRLKLLRVALHHAVADVAAARQGGAGVQVAQLRLHAIFSGAEGAQGDVSWNQC